LDVIQRQEAVYEWFKNEWVHLIAVDPKSRTLFLFEDGSFHEYKPFSALVPEIDDVFKLTEASRENLPVHLIA
jgi:uncharacterized protein